MEQALSLTGPALDGVRLLAGCGLGVGLGIWYGFLRPLRPAHTLLSDVLFVPALIWAWLYLGFAVCRGDLRLGYVGGLAVGAFGWELTFGKWLRPVFAGFWGMISRIKAVIRGCLQKNLQKIHKKIKNMLAIWKKWFTIKKHSYQRKRKVLAHF